MVASTAPRTILPVSDVGHGPTLVFIHGLTFSRRTWAPITRRLAEDFRCISVDLPAHGDCTEPAGSLDRSVELLHDTLVHIQVEKPAIVGHSMGSAIAMLYASRYPVAALVNVDQSPLITSFAQFLREMEPALRGAEFDRAFQPFQRSIGVDLLPEPARHEAAATQRVEQDVVLAYWSDLLTQDADEIQAKIDAAVPPRDLRYLHLSGSALPPADRDYLEHFIPHARIEEWQEHGHMVHLFDPDRFAALLRDFLG